MTVYSIWQQFICRSPIHLPICSVTVVGLYLGENSHQFPLFYKKIRVYKQFLIFLNFSYMEYNLCPNFVSKYMSIGRKWQCICHFPDISTGYIRFGNHSIPRRVIVFVYNYIKVREWPGLSPRVSNHLKIFDVIAF